MIEELLCVGTRHFDLEGPLRMRKILNYFKPSYLAIEIDEAGTSQANSLHQYLQSNSNLIQAVERFIKQFPGANPETVEQILPTIGFEYLVAREYSDSNSVPLALCDDVLTRFMTADLESRGMDELSTLLKMTPDELKRYTTDRYNATTLDVGTDIEMMSSRDVLADKRIRTLSGRVLSTGGINHFFGSYRNLFSRLNDLNPKRMRLNEADALPPIQTYS